jgi:hypothetical protein
MPNRGAAPTFAFSTINALSERLNALRKTLKEKKMPINLPARRKAGSQ